MPPSGFRIENAAAALLGRLRQHGVDYLIGNAGTDFPPVIEALAGAADGAAPTPLTAPHENVGVAMAHGCYLATGRPQAVMVHVNVGTANALCGMLNARRDRIPMVVMAGRTPIHETEVFGARTINIHWGQEMFDQAGMVREAVKWDYELRSGTQVADVVDRAVTLARQAPGGPVYLTLPREVIASDATPADKPLPAPIPGAGPNADAIEQAADLLSRAKRPLVITSALGQRPGDVAGLADFLDRHGAGAVGFRARYMFLANNHPAHLGYEPGPVISEADCIVSLDCEVPWIPQLHKPDPDASIIHIETDPGFGDYPMRSFPADCMVTGDPAAALAALDAALTARGVDEQTMAARKAWRAEAHERFLGLRDRPTGAVLTAQDVARALDTALDPEDILLTEAPFPVGLVRRTLPGTYFGTSSAGGLGWGLGAALGLKLGHQTDGRDPRVVAAVGDGSYMFGNPTPAHFMARAYDLPTLTVILNNRQWGAVRRATLSLYGDGAAAQSNDPPLTRLDPSPDYEKIVEASGGWGAKVARQEDLLPAIEEGLDAIARQRVPAVINVLTEYDDASAAADAVR